MDKPRAARTRPSDRLIGKPGAAWTSAGKPRPHDPMVRGARLDLGWWPLVAMYGCGLVSGYLSLRLWVCS
jgi:hypothetical protein